jgi:hypothetical protein
LPVLPRSGRSSLNHVWRSGQAGVAGAYALHIVLPGDIDNRCKDRRLVIERGDVPDRFPSLVAGESTASGRLGLTF